MPSAGAILGGQPDGETHPYVAFVGDPVTRASCSATLTADRAVTAAHCFAPGATVVVYPYAEGPARAARRCRHVHPPNPDFCKPPACTGDPSDPAFFVTDDVAVVKLSQPVGSARYAELPKIEKSQGKGQVQKYVGKDVRLLGYGVQGFIPSPFSDFTRTIAHEELARPIPVAADKFVQIDQEAAGFASATQAARCSRRRRTPCSRSARRTPTSRRASARRSPTASTPRRRRASSNLSASRPALLDLRLAGRVERVGAGPADAHVGAVVAAEVVVSAPPIMQSSL